MTTRRLELASDALAAALGRLWTAEKKLKEAADSLEYAQNQHHADLLAAHEKMAEFREAAAEWNKELGPHT